MQTKRRGYKALWVIACVMVVLSIVASNSYANEFKKDCDSADMVLINGKVLTVDKHFSIAQAIAVKDGRFLMVGSNHQVKHLIGRKTKVIDLQGKTVAPGANDSHGHATSWGAAQPPVSLVLGYPTVTSVADIQAVLATRVADPAVPDGQWIRGAGWDPSFLVECQPPLHDPNNCLFKEQLDGVSPNNPVIFTDFSYHNIWVNSLALQLAGITKDTPNPSGGIIVKDPVTGEPTGILRELSAVGLVGQVVPLFTKEELRESLLVGMREMAKNGITSYTEAALGPGGDTYGGGVLGNKVIDVYKDLYNEGKLTARISILLLFGEYGAGGYDGLKEGIDTYDWPKGYDPKWLRFPGVKVFADGIPPTKTSWLWDEYVGGGFGSLTIAGATDEEKVEQLTKMIEYGHKKGFQVPVHATGDRAITTAVDAFKGAMKKFRWNKDPRHYIIHGDLIRPEDLQTLAKMRGGVNMQPYIQFLIADIEPAVIGPERAAYEWPFKTALDSGARLMFSSDLGVTYPNWRRGVQAAITRRAFPAT